MIRYTIISIVALVAIYSAALCDDQIKVTVSKPFTMISAPPTFIEPDLLQLGSRRASLLCAIWTMPDAPMPMAERRQTVLSTEDGGHTWGRPTVLSGIASGGRASIRLGDGAAIWLGYFTDMTGNARTVSCSIGRSSDNGKTFTWTPGSVAFPEDVNPWLKGLALMVFSRSIVELPDKSLLATMYGKYEGGAKYRSMIVRSTDGGTNWNYYSTVAYNSNAPGEGYCEPVVQRTADGNLLCVMRLGGGITMQASRSTDNGRTWSKPSPLPEWAKSVDPDLCLMSNGVLALSFGRPGEHIAFSVDGSGKTWNLPTIIYKDLGHKLDNQARLRETTCGYTSIKEVAPEQLLYVYDFTEGGINTGSPSDIKGVYVNVKRISGLSTPGTPRRQSAKLPDRLEATQEVNVGTDPTHRAALAPDDSAIDSTTLANWSKKFRGWHYWPEHVISANPKIEGFPNIRGTDAPAVYQVAGDEKWYMSFIGFDSQGYQSFVAESNDLIHWRPKGLAMGFGPAGQFDHGGCVIGAYLYESYDLKAPRILKKREGKYWTLYGAYPRQGGYELRPGYEGVACSDDGFTWQRAKEGYILSVHDPDCCGWEKDCIYQPWLVEHAGKFYDFYNAALGSREQTGLATSPDLLNWTRYPGNPLVRNRPGGYDESFCSDPRVFRDGDHWVMLYFGVGRGHAHIMAAFSRDLLHWTADPEPLYKAGGNPSGLDKQFAHKISLVYNAKEDSYYMYYCAVGSKGRGIGLITSRPRNKEDIPLFRKTNISSLTAPLTGLHSHGAR
jgi:predicted GH43/DUF377 family glycosyl hydrolase